MARRPNDSQLLLGDAEWCLRDYLYWPSEHHYTVGALYLGAASLRDMNGDFKPYALGFPLFISEGPGTGKTFSNDTMCRMIPGGQLIINPSSYGLMQWLKNGGGAGIEEVDKRMGTRGVRNQDLMSIILGAYKRGTKVMLQRSDEPEPIEIQGPIILTGNHANAILHHAGYAPLRDRSYPFLLEKPPEDIELEEYDPELDDERLEEMRARFKTWGQENWRAILDIPKSELGIDARIKDRPREIWTILYRVAAYAGGEWPRRVNDAAKALVLGEWNGGRAVLSPSEELLWAIRSTFTDDDEWLPTTEIIARLVRLPQCPQMVFKWTTEKAGTMAIARALRAFGIEHEKQNGTWGYSAESVMDDSEGMGAGNLAT